MVSKLVSLNCFEELPTLNGSLSHCSIGTAACNAITLPRRSVPALVSHWIQVRFEGVASTIIHNYIKKDTNKKLNR